MNFKIVYSLRQISFAVFHAVICHHTVALPSKRIVNKHRSDFGCALLHREIQDYSLGVIKDLHGERLL